MKNEIQVTITSTLDILEQQRENVTGSIKKLEDAIETLKRELVRINRMIDSEKQVNTTDSPKISEDRQIDFFTHHEETVKREEDPKPRFKWQDKIIAILKTECRVMRNRDIVKQIFPLASPEELKKRIIDASGAFNNMKDRKILKAWDKKGVMGLYFGLPDWFDSNEIPKEEYMPK